MAVSAMDALVRTFVVGKIRQVLTDRKAALPEESSSSIMKYSREDDLLEAARKDDWLDRVDKALRTDFDRRSYQGTKNIAECLKLVGLDNVFHDITTSAKVNEDKLVEELERFTKRRHGDYGLTQNPPQENVIRKKEAEECIKIVRLVAWHARTSRQLDTQEPAVRLWASAPSNLRALTASRRPSGRTIS